MEIFNFLTAKEILALTILKRPTRTREKCKNRTRKKCKNRTREKYKKRTRQSNRDGLSKRAKRLRRKNMIMKEFEVFGNKDTRSGFGEGVQ